jgi:hypothetical protein
LRTQDGQKVGERALLDQQLAVHVDFAEFELRIEQNTELGAAGGETHRHRHAGSVAQGESRPARGSDPQVTRMYESFQRHPKQPVHRPPPPAFHKRHARDTIAVHRRRPIYSRPGPVRDQKAKLDAGIKTKSSVHGNAEHGTVADGFGEE